VCVCACACACVCVWYIYRIITGNLYNDRDNVLLSFLMLRARSARGALQTKFGSCSQTLQTKAGQVEVIVNIASFYTIYMLIIKL